MSKNHRKSFLDRAVQDLASGVDPRNIDSVIADWLERDLSSLNGDEMTETHETLLAFVYDVLHLLPEEQSRALRNDSDPIQRIVYYAGMAGMAQLIAAKAMTSRVGFETLAILQDPDNLDTLIAIRDQDLSIDEIVAVAGADEGIVRERMVRLADAGVAIHRHSGIKVVWSLSPSFGPMVDDMQKQRERNQAVEAAISTLSAVDGEDARNAVSALQRAFEDKMDDPQPMPTPS